MSEKNPKVDAVWSEEKKWRKEFEALRAVALGSGLSEELKWYQSCYTLDGKNVVLIHGFKEYCALLFFKGALLKDPHGILSTPGQHQASRQIRFKNMQEVAKRKAIVRAYIHEAIELEKAGAKVKLKKTSDFTIPDELQQKFKELPALKTAFNALTPGRQRGYIFHFSQPKQAKTRETRVEKYLKQILGGKGLND